MKVKSPTGKTITMLRYSVNVTDGPRHHSVEQADTIEAAKKIARRFLPKSLNGEVLIIKLVGSDWDSLKEVHIICRYIVHPRTGRKKSIFQTKAPGGYSFGRSR